MPPRSSFSARCVLAVVLLLQCSQVGTIAGGLGALDFNLLLDQAPFFTSNSRATFQVGAPGTFNVTAGGSPTPSLSGPSPETLPSGITFNSVTGVLGGTASAGTGGMYFFNFFAYNGAGPIAAQPFQLRINTAPSAAPDALGTFRDTPVNVTTAILRANDLDSDSDPLTVVSVAPGGGSDAGTVSLNAGLVTYTPKPGFVGTDAFTYLLSDDQGGNAHGIVSVSIVPRELFQVSAVQLAPGRVQLTGQGAPYATYVIQSAASPSSSYTNLSGPLQADAAGVFSFTDHNAPLLVNFYRGAQSP